MPLAFVHLLASAASGGFTPVWPYIVGGLAAIVTVIIGASRMYAAWRASIEEEATKKEQNTRALEQNTIAAQKNSTAIADLTMRFDRFEQVMDRLERRLDTSDGRISRLERGRGTGTDAEEGEIIYRPRRRRPPPPPEQGS